MLDHDEVHLVVVGGDGQDVAVLARVADHGGDVAVVLGGVLAALADAVEAPGALEVAAAIRGAVELVVVVVVVGHDLVALLDRDRGLAHVREVLAGGDFGVGHAVV